MSQTQPQGTAAAIIAGPWYREISGASWRTLTLAGAGWTFDCFDGAVGSLTLPALIAVFALSKAEAGAITSMNAAGMVIGGIIFGWVADRIGRVRALVLCVCIYSGFCGLTAIAPSGMWVAALRFLTGLGMGGAWTSSAALVAETWDPQHRGKGGALMQMGLPIGSMLAIGAAAAAASIFGGMNGNGWRALYALGVLPAIIVLLLARRTPESPLWQRRAQSPGARGGLQDLFVRGNARGLVLGLAFVFCCQYLWWGVLTWTPTFLVSVKHLSFVHSLSFVMTQQIGSLCGFLVFAALVDRIGRRPTFLLYLLIGAVSLGVFVLVSTPIGTIRHDLLDRLRHHRAVRRPGTVHRRADAEFHRARAGHGRRLQRRTAGRHSRALPHRRPGHLRNGVPGRHGDQHRRLRPRGTHHFRFARNQGDATRVIP